MTKVPTISKPVHWLTGFYMVWTFVVKVLRKVIVLGKTWIFTSWNIFLGTLTCVCRCGVTETVTKSFHIKKMFWKSLQTSLEDLCNGVFFLAKLRRSDSASVFSVNRLKLSMEDILRNIVKSCFYSLAAHPAYYYTLTEHFKITVIHR